MQFKLQHADSQADDPHDAIVAQLRDLAPRLTQEPSGVDVTPAPLTVPVSEPEPSATPLNDNIGDIRDLTPRARSGRGVALLIVCAGMAAAVAWHFYGEEAKASLPHLVPQLLAGAPAPTQSANAADPQNVATTAPQPPAQEAAATPTQPATAPATPSMEAPPAQSAMPPEVAQSIETMANEIASLKQTVEQLQAGQQQLNRDIAKATEHEARRKIAAQTAKPSPPPRAQQALTPGAPPRNLGTLPPYSPPPAYSQGQTNPQGAAQREAYIPPSAPTQLPPQPGDTSVPRPPMPLR